MNFNNKNKDHQFKNKILVVFNKKLKISNNKIIFLIKIILKSKVN